jgi:hypothetical protein
VRERETSPVGHGESGLPAPLPELSGPTRILDGERLDPQAQGVERRHHR